MNTLSLRDYQKELVNKIFKSNSKRILVQLPTGSGKSVIMKYIAKFFDSHLILTHRKEIKSIFDGYHVEMVEKHYKSLRMTQYDVILADEVHLMHFDKVVNWYSPDQLIIGFTATPVRTGNQKSLHLTWDTLIEGSVTQELIDNGYLVPTENYSYFDFSKQNVKKSQGDYDLTAQANIFEKKRVYRGVFQNYMKICPGKKAILFAPNIEATKQICGYLQQYLPQVKYIDSSLSAKERDEIVDWFKNTSNAILCNCNILTTGFDCPDIECVILYRATVSYALYNQMIGRGSRSSPNKEKLYVLDFGENVKRHGFWEEPPKFKLFKQEKAEKGLPPVKLCPQCQKILRSSASRCDKCGYIYPIKADNSFLVELQKIESPISKKKQVDIALHQAKNLDEAKEILKKNHYKIGYLYANKSRFPNLYIQN